ncbi:MAG: right-handed parallel beta-helix repeat-containing protein [Lentisphaeria bacterium]
MNLKIMLITGIMAAGLLLSAADYSKEISEVKSGKISEAKAAWWGYDPRDASKCLQDALNSGAKKVLVENVGSDWITGPLIVPSNIEIVFQDGVVIRAKKGDFKDVNDALFKIKKQKNVILRGIGSVLFVMNKKDYQDKTQYKHAEWRHTIGIQESDGISVDNLTLRSSGGDGVYVGSMDCRNIRLTNLLCEDHHRQGFSVTGVKNLYVKNCKFSDTSGTAPECGLDLEPNYKDGVGLQNVVFENCEFTNNNLAGIYISNNSHLPTSITFRDCLIKDNRQSGIGLGHTAMGNPELPGKIEFIRCRIEGHKTPSVTLGLHIVPNLKLVFEDCVIDNRLSQYNAMILASDSPKDVYGIEIRNLTVLDDQDRAPIIFYSKYGNALIDPVVENVIVKNSKGESKAFDCAKFIRESAPDPVAKAFQVAVMDRANFVPNSANGEVAGEQIRFRGNTDYFVYARAGSKINIRFTNVIVHAFDSKPLEVTLSTPTVPNVKRLEIPFKDSLDYTLEAGETGIYKFAIAARVQTVKVSCSAPGQVFSSSEKLYVFGCSGTLYFMVPAGVKTVQLEAGGVLREASDAWLLDPSGKVVAAGLRLAGSKILSAERADPGKSEIWGVKFNASKLFLRLGAPIVQIFSTSPANLLAEK